jgi:hypothetical protein
MKKSFLLALPLLLAGCSVNPAQVAADAAFCASAESVLNTVQNSYQQNVVDSEFLASATEFLSDITAPLSDALGDDIKSLSEQLSSSQPVSETEDAVDGLIEDIKLRCSEVGVEF